jgi:hypothetical protein
VNDGVKSEVQQSLSDVTNLAQKVDGDYDKLTPEEKQKVLNAYGGDEASARMRFKFITHPQKTGPAFGQLKNP